MKNLDDLGKVVVKTEKGVPVYLSDLGKLKYGNLERKGVLGFTDHKRDYSDGIEGVVQLLRHQNPSKVLAGIHKAIDELNNEDLPAGVKIHPFMDRTELVQSTLDKVSHTLLMGMFLVIAVLIIFLGSWRGALLVALTIPLSLLIAFMLMYLTKIPANLLSLGAIDFGIIVEGAIVMMETILKKREDNQDIELEEKSIVKRSLEVARPIFFSTIIIITAYLPLFAFERIEKKLFTPMAFTVGYALIGALLVALLLIPGLAYIIYRKPQKTFRNRWMEKLTGMYYRQTKRMLEKPKKVFTPLVIIFISALVLAIMFLLLFGAFGKSRQASLLMGVVPLALFGGMLALNIFGMSLNVSSAVGFISLFGVSIENGVIMIAHINDLRKEGKNLKEAVLEGTKHRFRPIVMIATVAILGLLPASLSTGIGSDVQRPLATVIVYGLFFATIITLYVLPAMFYLVEKRWSNKNTWENNKEQVVRNSISE